VPRPFARATLICRMAACRHLVVFGLAFGNGTWLPPLIAQVEFVEEDVQRVVALIVASSQAGYAFAPVCFGFIRQATANATGAPGRRADLFRRCGARPGSRRDCLFDRPPPVLEVNRGQQGSTAEA
jgi:hypothetical protein